MIAKYQSRDMYLELSDSLDILKHICRDICNLSEGFNHFGTQSIVLNRDLPLDGLISNIEW